MINIKPKHLEIVLSILGKYNYSFYVFGSRITDKIKEFSDLDLFYTEDIPEKIIMNIENEFEESDLPYKVDIVNYNKCDKIFQEIMKLGCVKLKKE
ncbi:MAG: nucleotidyltransferase domain-containing protein [Rickettsiaceae bacterium]